MNQFQLQAETTLETEQLQVLHRKIVVSDYFQLSITSGFAATPQLLTYEVPQIDGATVGFNFCIKGAANYFNKGKYSPARADTTRFNHILFPRAETTCNLEVSGVFEQITFFIGKNRYLDLLGSFAELQPKGFLRAAEVPGYCFFNKNLWTPAFRQIAFQILQNQMAGAGARLYFEGKMLEVTGLLLETYRQKPIEFVKPSHGEVEKMHHARNLLENNLTDPPGLAKLARLVGTNEFALKRNFKATFGLPVFKYLQQMRLEKAHQLIQNSDMLVSDVACQVGYDSLSAFSRAFKEKFGVQPQVARSNSV